MRWTCRKNSSAFTLNAGSKTFDAAWQDQEPNIIVIRKEDPFGAKGVPPGELHKIDNVNVRQTFEPDIDLTVRARAMLKLFHNMRAALHVPDQPPEKTPPLPGRDITTRSAFWPQVY